MRSFEEIRNKIKMKIYAVLFFNVGSVERI